MRWLVLFAVGCVETEEAGCPIGTLAESQYCGDDGVSCGTLDARSQGCIGSHTEQVCELDGQQWTKVGGDDAADLYYDGNALAAVRRVDEGASDECPDAWFGLDLSACALQGEPVTVYCEPQGE